MSPRRLLASSRAEEELRGAFERIRDDVGAPREFPAPVLEEAEESVATAAMPDLDLTGLPFVTIDPEGSKDLDQAMSLERTPTGFRVHYAIADVGGFVRPGGALDAEAHARGLTLYCPDARVPLTPPVLSEGAASLLPDQDRPAAVWTIELDGDGEGRSVEVRRARVRSREQLSFEDAQSRIEAGDDEQLALLREVGALRQERERARGGMSITLPEQQVVTTNGGFRLAYRAPLPVEDWNAQMSLLTGAGAATLMLRAGVGVLRTMPDPQAEDLDRLRRTARGLGIHWPDTQPYAEVVHTLDPSTPAHAAFLTSATVLLRGAGYTVFAGEEPSLATHAAVGGPYAHVTAPLRRLVDRYATAICLAECAGEPVPEWVIGALPELPREMGTAERRSAEVERACVEVVEAAALRDHVGEDFSAVVVDIRKDGAGVVQLADPAVRARCEAGPALVLGARVVVRLAEANPATRTVRFVLA